VNSIPCKFSCSLQRLFIYGPLGYGQSILKKTMKSVVTKFPAVWLKCIKFNFGWGSTLDSAGGGYIRHSNWISRA